VKFGWLKLRRCCCCDELHSLSHHFHKSSSFKTDFPTRRHIVLSIIIRPTDRSDGVGEIDRAKELTMTIPDLSRADIVVIGFGGTAPAKVHLVRSFDCSFRFVSFRHRVPSWWKDGKFGLGRRRFPLRRLASYIFAHLCIICLAGWYISLIHSPSLSPTLYVTCTHTHTLRWGGSCRSCI